MSSKNRSKIIAMREKGLPQLEIANACGVSRQYVSHILAKHNPNLSRVFTKEMCIYEGLRKWLNDNHIYITELVRILHGGVYAGGNSACVVRSRLNGKTQFKMSEINKLLERSGLTYEELFRKGE